MTPTRTTFEGLATWEVAVWYVLVVVSTAVLVWGIARLVLKYRLGRRRPLGLDHLPRRLARGLASVFSHDKLIRRQPLAGTGHLLIFYGFLVLFIGTVTLAIQDDFAKPLFHFDFWRGSFYLTYSLFLDLFGAALIVGLTVMAVTRGVLKPPRLDYRRPVGEPGSYDRTGYVIGDWVFVAALVFLALSGFLLEALRIAERNPAFEVWSPVGWTLAQALRGIGVSGDVAANAHHVVWWVHGAVALSFVASIPFTKAVHIIASAANLVVRDELAGKKLPRPVPGGVPGEVGYARITDLSWQHLLSLDACTKCGRCHVSCPATAAGYPLSPRDLVLDLREAAEGSLGIRATLGVPPLHDPHAPLLGDVIRPETVWSCTQCMACVQVCPVGIEHVPIINQLRRQLVEKGDMDATLQATFETINTTGNSFGEPRRKRGRWSRELPFEVKDIRQQPADLLWYVGDFASFDPRNQRVNRALAQVLQHARADFGILHEAEKTAGCDVRRAGEEGLWASLAEQNIATISACEFKRIFSSDPHTFHTLKNEYPELGGRWTVLHHSELLLELIEAGTLKPRKQLGYRATYHDPCMLGRYNGVYEAPRRLLQAIGLELVEMPRNRANSFCCGAGGGRIWMKELRPEGVKRPSEQRIDEAVALGGIDYFVVACPKDVTMYEDAIKTSGHQGEIQLREISELILEALDLAPEGGAGAEQEEAN
ncbi:MAG TPA: (Fe-S)-binding protein [Candidatus Dormibacteraeota bacterium]|nr:(Fe-S)-binding protein [Candidatus Dormibacteraeota bacterium]